MVLDVLLNGLFSDSFGDRSSLSVDRFAVTSGLKIVDTPASDDDELAPLNLLFPSLREIDSHC